MWEVHVDGELVAVLPIPQMFFWGRYCCISERKYGKKTTQFGMFFHYKNAFTLTYL